MFNFTSAILVGILIFFWISWLWGRRKYYIMSYRVPGPIGYPLLGSGNYFMDQTLIFKTMTDWKKKYGPTYTGYLGIRPCYITSDPKMVENIFTNELLVDKMDIYHAVDYFIPDGLFTSEYKKWSYSRKHINKAFVHKVLISFYPIFNVQIKGFCDYLSKYAGKGEFDILHYIERVQLDTTCMTTMGQETNFLRGQNSELLQAFTDCIKTTSARIFNPILSNKFLFKYLFTSQHNEYEKNLSIMRLNTLHMVEKKLAQIETAQKENPNQDQDSSPEEDMNITKSKSIFIDIMVREYMSGNFTWEDMQSEVNTMILAAFETTTNVLFMTIIMLAMNPQYQDKVYEEVISILPVNDDEQITHEHGQQLIYTEMVMNETMRILSPVPLVGRNATTDMVLCNGDFIPKGTNVIIDIFNLHRDEGIWGPNADRIFNPDNFLKDNITKIHPYAFVPFTKGIRNCIGWRYATISNKIMLASLIKKYKISTSFKFEDLVYTENIVLKFAKNPKISIELRKK